MLGGKPATRPDLLTVILPQSLEKQPEESRELLLDERDGFARELESYADALSVSQRTASAVERDYSSLSAEFAAERVRLAEAFEAAEQLPSVRAAEKNAVVDELRAELHKAQGEAKESLTVQIRLESANEKLNEDLASALAAVDAAAAARDEANEKRVQLQTELGALRSEVARSRESVSKAMADVQSQVEQRKSQWSEERKTLMTQLQAAEQKVEVLSTQRARSEASHCEDLQRAYYPHVQVLEDASSRDRLHAANVKVTFTALFVLLFEIRDNFFVCIVFPAGFDRVARSE